jgi:hypothetical protein
MNFMLIFIILEKKVEIMAENLNQINLYVNDVKEIDNNIKIEFEYIYKTKLNSNEFKECLNRLMNFKCYEVYPDEFVEKQIVITETGKKSFLKVIFEIPFVDKESELKKFNENLKSLGLHVANAGYMRCVMGC